MRVKITRPSLRVLMLIRLWLEYYYLFLRFFDLPLALRDRRPVNAVQYWCGPVVVNLRMVRDVHWLNAGFAISFERRRMSADSLEDLCHLQTCDFWVRTTGVA